MQVGEKSWTHIIGKVGIVGNVGTYLTYLTFLTYNTPSELPSSRHRLPQRPLIRKLNIRAHGKTVCEARNFWDMQFELLLEKCCCGFAFHIRIRCNDEFPNRSHFAAIDKFAELQLFRTHAING